MIQDENCKLEANGGKGGPVFDCEGIIHANSPKQLDCQFALGIKDEASPLPIVHNQTLLQPTNTEDNLSREEIELIKEDDAIKTALVDQLKEEENQHMLVNIEGDEMEIHSGQVIDSTGGSVPKSTMFVVQGACLPVPGNSSLSKDEKLDNEEGSLAFETVEVIQKDETFEAADAEQRKDDATSQMIEVNGSLTTETIEVKKRNEKHDANHKNQGNGNTPSLTFAEEENKCDQHDCLLNIGANEASKRNEALEATYENQSNTVTLMAEVGSLAIENVEVLEEVKLLQEPDGKDKSELLLVGEEKGAQHDEEITGGENQATGETAQYPDDIALVSNQEKLQTEEPEILPNVDQADNSFSDELTSEDSPSEDCGANVPNMSSEVSTILAQLKPGIGSDNGFTKAQLFVAASEVSKENVASEPDTEDRVVANEKLLMQLTENQQHASGKTLEKVEDSFQMQYAENVTIGDRNLMRPEEDSIDDKADDDEYEANMAEKVEERSEGTGDSFVESNTEPICLAESMQEVTMELKELKLNEQKEKQQNEEDQTVKTQVHMHLKNIDNDDIDENSLQKGNDEKGYLKMTFLERYMREVGNQIHQPTSSQKRRVLILTLLVLSWSLCFWRFGLPFLKICLIFILIKIISKIHGI